MPLTKKEREFLDAYVYEATHEPFGGPATNDLRDRGIYYADLHGLLTSYHHEMSKERTLSFGKQNLFPPPSPWTNRQEVECRNRALLEEWTEKEKEQSFPDGHDGSTDLTSELSSPDQSQVQ